MRKVLSLLCAAALALGLLPAMAQAAPGESDIVISAQANGGSRSLNDLRPGDNVVVTVTLPAGKVFCSAGVRITFDAGRFECTAVNAGSAITGANWGTPVVSAPATANANQYAAVSAIYTQDGEVANTTAVAGALTLCTAAFTVKSSAVGAAAFGLSRIEIGRIDGGNGVFYPAEPPAPVSVAIKGVLPSLALDALNIEIGQTAAATVSGTGFTGSISWTGVTGGSLISTPGSYTALITLSPAGNYYAFAENAPVTYGGVTLSTSGTAVGSAAARILSRTPSQIQVEVSRTIPAPVSAGTVYTSSASGSADKIAATVGDTVKKTATVTFTNTLASPVSLTITNTNPASFSYAAAAGASLTGSVLTLPARGTASLIVTLNATQAGSYDAEIRGAYTYNSVALTASASVTAVVAASTSGGGGGGGGAGGGGGLPPGGEEPQEDEPGETGEPVPLGDISGTVTLDGASAQLSFTQEAITQSVSQAPEDSFTIDLSGLGSIASVSLPSDAAGAVGASDRGLTVRTDSFSMTFENPDVAEIAFQLGENDRLALSAVPVEENQLSAAQRAALHENAVIVDLNATVVECDDTGKETGVTRPAAFSGQVKVSIPYTPRPGQDPSQLVVYRLNSDGSMVYLRTVYENGILTFWTDSFSIYVAVACPLVSYTDCELNAWYHSAVDYVLESGIMTGVDSGIFAPKDGTSRAMVVTVLWRLDGRRTDAPIPAFTDLTADWYRHAVAWAYANGITTGVSESLFNPDGPMTREQFAAFLYRYAKQLGYDVSAAASLQGFEDAGAVSPYAQSSMRWAVASGIISGRTATTLAPQEGATRAEMAAMLMRFCQNVLK